MEVSVRISHLSKHDKSTFRLSRKHLSLADGRSGVRASSQRIKTRKADSAGCGDWHVGEPAHKGTRQILRDQRIEYSGRARKIHEQDFADFDYIITMDEDNLRYATMMKESLSETRAQIFPLLDFSPIARKNGLREVPDPYYVGGFDGVFRLVHAGCAGLLEHIRREHGLE